VSVPGPPVPPPEGAGDAKPPQAERGGGASFPEPPLPPREALAEVRVPAPTRGNRRLEALNGGRSR
jgi:hypothetical protein